MTQDEIIRMAREAGCGVSKNCLDNPMYEFTSLELERFAALVAAHEREACAKVCDIYAIDEGGFVSQSCAAAIRARGEK